ncbi:MAG: L,D-transpeptidase family protein [Halanaerobiaceae bacterium]
MCKIYSDRARKLLTLGVLMMLVGVAGGVVVNISGDGIMQVQKDKEEEEYEIKVNLYQRTLTLYLDGDKRKTYPVAIGKTSTKTPVGEWAIISKSKNWGGVLGTRWLGLNVPWGIYGIHGTDKPGTIGRAASHGCIRMYNRHVEELYDIIPTKTRVVIVGKRLPVTVNHPLNPGETGLDVMQLQDNLKEYKFAPGYNDGRYGSDTEKAVKELEAQFALSVDGRADWDVIYLLELPEGNYYNGGEG